MTTPGSDRAYCASGVDVWGTGWGVCGGRRGDKARLERLIGSTRLGAGLLGTGDIYEASRVIWRCDKRARRTGPGMSEDERIGPNFSQGIRIISSDEICSSNATF